MPTSSKPAYEITWVTDQLGVGQAPMSFVQLESIRAQGVDAILNLCGEFCDLHEIEASAGFEVHYLPLKDEEAPNLIELEKALAWLDEAIYLGKKVLIHCRHGIGRTGTVLNAYLLRRGLGHRLAWLALRKLKSKPANFVQWRTVRKYGKQSGRLTVREPSLEFKRLVDLSPFFHDYEELVQRAAERVGESLKGRVCGLDSDQCCSTPVRLSLIEAVHLTHSMNKVLDSDARVALIERAVEVARKERVAVRDLGVGENTDYCLSEAGTVCPLLEAGICRLFDYRPLQCRTFGLEEVGGHVLWHEMLTPALHKISAELWFAYTGSMDTERLPLFSLPDVVSGKFMETVFKIMMHQGLARTA